MGLGLEADSLQYAIQTREQMRDRFFRFVAHVGEAEGFALDPAVAAVDDEVVFGAQIAHELGNIDAAAVSHARESLRAVAFFGEEVEAGAANPIVDKRVRSRVALVAVCQAFGENIVELRFERVNVRDARGGRGHIVLLVFFEFQEVEVVTAIVLLLRAREPLFGNGKEREAGRQGERLLAAGEKNVDAELIHGNRHSREGRDAVDDECHIGIFPGDGADFFERIHHAGGGFVVDQGDGVELACYEFFLERLRVDRFAPIDLERLGGFSATPADVEPFVGEGAAHAVEDAAGNEIADGSFHHAPGRGGGEENGLFGSKQSLEARMNGSVESAEVFAAMADHRA